jgi:hypothetical protein
MGLAAFSLELCAVVKLGKENFVARKFNIINFDSMKFLAVMNSLF